MDGSAATGAGAASSAAQAQAHHAHGHGNGGPASSMSPTSPVSARSHGLPHASAIGANGAAKRKRSSVGMIGSSPGSVDGDDDLAGDHNEKKRQPGVKRACNECRQQKVSLVPSPSPSPSHGILLAHLHKSTDSYHLQSFFPPPPPPQRVQCQLQTSCPLSSTLHHHLLTHGPDCLVNSCDAMLYKTPSRAAPDVSVSNSTARLSPILSASASAVNMQRWNER